MLVKKRLTYIDIRYKIKIVIKSFNSKITIDVYNGITSRYTRSFANVLHRKAQRVLDQINAAGSLETLRIPPSNHLEKLSGDLKGIWSIRINDQWRIIFRWDKGDAYDVEIIDYH